MSRVSRVSRPLRPSPLRLASFAAVYASRVKFGSGIPSENRPYRIEISVCSRDRSSARRALVAFASYRVGRNVARKTSRRVVRRAIALARRSNSSIRRRGSARSGEASGPARSGVAMSPFVVSSSVANHLSIFPSRLVSSSIAGRAITDAFAARRASRRYRTRGFDRILEGIGASRFSVSFFS